MLAGAEDPTPAASRNVLKSLSIHQIKSEHSSNFRSESLLPLKQKNNVWGKLEKGCLYLATRHVTFKNRAKTNNNSFNPYSGYLTFYSNALWLLL